MHATLLLSPSVGVYVCEYMQILKLYLNFLSMLICVTFTKSVAVQTASGVFVKGCLDSLLCVFLVAVV